MPHSFALLFAALTALTLGVIDHRTGRMPNRWTLASLACALALKGGLGGASGFIHALCGLALVASVPLALFFFSKGKAIGGGDVKALAALGAWLGPIQGLEAEMLAFLILAGFAVGREAWQGRLLALLRRSLSLLASSRRPGESSRNHALDGPSLTEVRFGPSLAVGTFLVCLAAFTREAPWLLLLS